MIRVRREGRLSTSVNVGEESRARVHPNGKRVERAAHFVCAKLPQCAMGIEGAGATGVDVARLVY